MTKFKKFAIYTGYVENQSNAAVLWEHNEGFDTVHQAAENILNILKKVALKERTARLRESLRSCCYADRECNYCSNCGSKITDQISDEDTQADSSEMFLKIHSGTCGDGNDADEALMDAGWNLWAGPSDGYVSIINFDQWLEDNDSYELEFEYY